MSRRDVLLTQVAILRAELEWRDLERLEWRTERAEWRARLEAAEARARDAERALWLMLGLPAVPAGAGRGNCEAQAADGRSVL